MKSRRNFKRIVTSFLTSTMVVSSLLTSSVGASSYELKALGSQNKIQFKNIALDKNLKIPAYISGNLSLPSKSSPEEIVKEYLKTDKDNSFIVYKKSKNNQNENVIKIIQTYKGIKVKGTLQSYIIGTDGVIKNISGIHIPDMSKKTSGSYLLSEKEALQVVKKDLSINDDNIDYLKVEKAINPSSDCSQYAYIVSIELKSPQIEAWEYVINGSNGNILNKNNMLLAATQDVQGKGPFDDIRTLKGYNGPASNLKFPQRNSYALADLTRQAPDNAISRPMRILTYEKNDITEIASDPDGNFNDPNQSHSVDTHHYLGLVYEFYKEKFNRYSLDNAGIDLEAYCHHMEDGKKDNAYYLPGSNKFYIGDGDGVYFNTFATAEVFGHEYTHGVIINESAMEGSGEPCSINEGLADLFSEVFSTYADGTPIDWLKLSKNFTPGTPNDAYLDYKNPQNTSITENGSIIGYYPDHMDNFFSGSIDAYGSHINAAILTKAFSLMCTGESFHGISVTSIDPEKLIQIMYKVITEYLTPSTNFNQFASMSLDAATKLYGENSQQYNSIKEGFQAVGILNNVSQWSKVTESPFILSGAYSSVQLGNKVYIMGGEYDDTRTKPSKEVWEYDIYNNNWSRKKDLLDFRDSGQAVSINNKIYLLSGEKDIFYGTLATTVDEFDPSTNSWKTIGNLPQKTLQSSKQFAPGTAITEPLGVRDSLLEVKTGQIGVNGSIIVRIQGSDDNITFEDVDSKSINTSNSTTQLTCSNKKYHRLKVEVSGAPCTFGINSISARAYDSAVAYDNKIYLIGGITPGDTYIRDIDVYDITTNQWSIIPNALSYPRRGHSAVFAVVNSKPSVYIFGGLYNSYAERNIEVFDITSGKCASPNKVPYNINLINAKCTFYKGLFHFINKTDNMNSTILYEPINNKWSEIPSSIKASKGTFAISNDNLYYIGNGGDKSFIFNIAVYKYDPLRLSAFSNSNSIFVKWSGYNDSINTNLTIDNSNAFSGLGTTFKYNNYINSSNKHVMKVSQSNPYYGAISSKPVCSVHQMIGDIDGDNIINTLDLALSKKFSLNMMTPSTLQCISADINGDNSVDSIDYTILYRYLYKQIPYHSLQTLRLMVYGDINNDGLIDFLDLNLIDSHISGNSTLSYGQIVAADVDGNGIVNNQDSNLIKSYIANNNIIFPVVNQ